MVGVIISGAVALVITVALTAVVRGLAPVIAAKGGRRGPRRTVGAGVAVVLATTGVMVAAPAWAFPNPARACASCSPRPPRSRYSDW